MSRGNYSQVPSPHEHGSDVGIDMDDLEENAAFVPATRSDPDEHRSYPFLKLWTCVCVGATLTFAATTFAPASLKLKVSSTLRSHPNIGEDDGSPHYEYGLSDTVPIPPVEGKKKVLVTGAAGFIGSHVAEYLLNRGDDVVVVDEVNDYYDVRVKEENLALLRRLEPSEDRLAIYRGDCADGPFMKDVFEKERPQYICHLAARAGVRYSIIDPYIYIHSNVEATTRLMDLSVKYNVTNFVYASSSSVYGGSKSVYFSEMESVDHPISPYAASKKSVELMAYTWHHLYGLKTTGLRFFTVYGPRGRPDMAPFIFVDRISRGKWIKQFGDGSTSRDYTFVDDIVNGVVRAVDRPYDYEVFNLGKGNGTKLGDFIGLVQKYTNKTADVHVLPEQPGDVPYTCADVRKAKRLLGYEATVQIEEGIRRTVEWYNSPTAVIAQSDEKDEDE